MLYDLNSVKLKQHAKYLGQRSFRSIDIVRTHRHTDTASISRPGPPKSSVLSPVLWLDNQLMPDRVLTWVKQIESS